MDSIRSFAALAGISAMVCFQEAAETITDPIYRYTGNGSDKPAAFRPKKKKQKPRQKQKRQKRAR